MPHRLPRTTEPRRRARLPWWKRRSPPELGGGEGCCLHLLLPANPWLSSSPSRLGGRQHLAATGSGVGDDEAGFVAGLDQKVKHFRRFAVGSSRVAPDATEGGGERADASERGR